MLSLQQKITKNKKSLKSGKWLEVTSVKSRNRVTKEQDELLLKKTSNCRIVRITNNNKCYEYSWWLDESKDPEIIHPRTIQMVSELQAIRKRLRYLWTDWDIMFKEWSPQYPTFYWITSVRKITLSEVESTIMKQTNSKKCHDFYIITDKILKKYPLIVLERYFILLVWL